MKEKQLNKVRNMKGSRPGGGSAGRANGNPIERRLTPPPVNPFTGFGDVGRACDAWLRQRDPQYLAGRAYIEQQTQARMARREAESGGDL